MKDWRELIEKFGCGPGGKPYFQEFKEDIRRMNQEFKETQGGPGAEAVAGKPADESMAQLEAQVDQILENFVYLK